MLLSAKLESDPANYDPEYLAYLRNRKHLGFDPAKVPDYYVPERKANERPWTEREPWPK